jgi:hypothetical protein
MRWPNPLRWLPRWREPPSRLTDQHERQSFLATVRWTEALLDRRRRRRAAPEEAAPLWWHNPQ